MLFKVAEENDFECQIKELMKTKITKNQGNHCHSKKISHEYYKDPLTSQDKALSAASTWQTLEGYL